DIESVPFLEAIRQLRLDLGPENVLYIHLTLVPTITVAGEVKTKPTQHSVKELLKVGIQPDILITRANKPLSLDLKKKISLFCNVPVNRVISAPDIHSTIYEVPVIYHKENLDDEIIKYFGMQDLSPLFSDEFNPALTQWQQVVDVFHHPKGIIKIAIVGKYISLSDAYRSLYEALWHGGIAIGHKVEFEKIDSETITERNLHDVFQNVHGILVPGGFGTRGIEGKLKAIQYARENKIPFFGICLGMQCAVIEFARNVLHWPDANSTEFDSETRHPVISLMEEQVNITDKGGTMRLGAYDCVVKPDTRLLEAYHSDLISERHRHRYEFTNRFREDFEKAGLVISGTSPDDTLVEAIELPAKIHPWFVATQFHPEFQSKPLKPHPLFREFIRHAFEYKSKF
ncbi:MAG: CTP synthase, partial [Candidatus Hydrogenedentota bacterium]